MTAQNRKPAPGPRLDGLPDAELEVLGCLWKRGDSTAREIRETMSGYRPMTHGAMVTLLGRLEEKKLVSKTKGPVGKAFVYSAKHAPQATYQSLMGRLRERIFGGSGLSMVASLFDGAPPDSKELEELEKLVSKLREKSGQKKRDK
jgi:BlaI family penicillinase repressor